MATFGRKSVNGEKGFTLVELMVVIAIFLLLLAIILQVYVKASQFITYFSAKDDILAAMNLFATQLNKYTDGAAEIFTVNKNGVLIPMSNWPDTATLQNIAFCTERLEYDGSPRNNIVYIYNESVMENGKQLYFRDKLHGNVCKPLMRVVVKVVDASGCENAETDIQYEMENNWVDGKEIIFKPKITDARNSFSYMYIEYRKFYINPSVDETITWPSIRLYSIFGVLHNIYDDNVCTHKVRGYGVDVYPYEQDFNIYGRNIERQQ